MANTGIYRHPNPVERKLGAIAVRNSDGYLFDGLRFISPEVEPEVPVSCVVEIATSEEEAAFEEWLSRLGVVCG